MKLLPNLALAAEELWFELELKPAEPSDAEAAVLEAAEGSVAVDVEPSRRRPVNSCLLDLRVVDTYGLRVVVLVDGGVGVVVELDTPAFNRTALNRVWNLLLRFPNFLLVEAVP